MSEDQTEIDLAEVFAGKDNAIACLASFLPDAFKLMLQSMADDGIRMGAAIGNGSMAHSAEWYGNDEGSRIPKGVIRIEDPEFLSLYKGNPIVLQPAFQKQYPVEGLGDYEVLIVPYVPDMGDKCKNVEDLPSVPDREDVLRTLRVLKRMKVEGDTCHIASDAELTQTGVETAFDHIKDFQHDQFVFIRNPKTGDYIRYPDNTEDPEFRGKKIAFIRDLNSIPAKNNPCNISLGDAAENGLPTDFLPAPVECAGACMQQCDLTQQLAHDLREAGIKPNVPIPETTGPSTMAITGVVPVQSEKKPKGQPL